MKPARNDLFQNKTTAPLAHQEMKLAVFSLALGALAHGDHDHGDHDHSGHSHAAKLSLPVIPQSVLDRLEFLETFQEGQQHFEGRWLKSAHPDYSEQVSEMLR
jgi:hypothetical protein